MDGWDIAMALAAAGDVGSTAYATAKPGVSEGNPFAPDSIEAMVAVKVATLALALAMRHTFIVKDCHAQAWVWTGAWIAAFAIATIANFVRF